ncbi:hypothetical protein BGZ81_002722 [Podila clonocystis]|nr:hypothetical protein BGZ81_002722 [Podila clonocystis]
MQSTGRVEKVHDLIKQNTFSKKTSLNGVFNAIQKRAATEELSWYARDEMLKEVNYALQLTSQPMEVYELLRLGDVHSEDTGGEMEVAQAMPSEGNFDGQDGINEFETLVQFKPTISKASMEVFLSSIGLDKIETVFKVSWLIRPRHAKDLPCKRQNEEEDYTSQVQDPPEVKGKGRPKNKRFIINLEKSRRGILSKPLALSASPQAPAKRAKRVSTCSKCKE